MKIKLLLVFATVIISVLFIFSYDFAFSVIPGWETIILPPLFISRLFLYWFLLIVVVYLLFFRRRINRSDILFYLVMTMPCIFLIELFKFTDDRLPERFGFLIYAFEFFVAAYFVAQVWFLVKVGVIGVRKFSK